MSATEFGIRAKTKFVAKTKQPKALWTKIKNPTFKSQLEKLNPERQKSGGMKWKSKSKEIADAAYDAIAEMFKIQNPLCQCCEKIHSENVHMPQWRPRWTDDIHHTRGRSGLLLLDIRFWKSACRTCHQWIGENPDKARELKLLCERGEWHKETK